MPKVIIIGSGFGGSIAALRFRQKGWVVSLNELGEDWPSSKMRQTQDTRYLYRLFRDYPQDYYARTDTLRPKLVIAQGMGVGGGSLIYSGIHLRAPTTALAGWPSGWRRPDLDFYYGKVETNLGVVPTGNYPRLPSHDFPRRSVFAQGAASAGFPAPVANPLSMPGCTFCGWCVPNCIFDKKQSMALTYIARAKTWSGTGSITVWPHWKATRVTRNGAGYRVYFISTAGRRDNYHLVNSGGEVYEDADKVVIACGAIESPVLLQRSLSYLYGFNTTNLGRNIDGQGDAVVGGIVPQTTDSFKGAIMMDHIDMSQASVPVAYRGDYVLEDIHSIPAGVGVKYPASFPSLGNALWGLAFKQKVRDFEKKMLGVAIMGKSPSGANITVSDQNGIAVVSTAAYQPPTNSIAGAKRIITALGGELAATPWDREGMAATVHPTGGCAMGEIVNTTTLEVYNNPGLHVIDGSVFPTNTWRNPSHTIAAVAEKALATLLGAPPAW